MTDASVLAEAWAEALASWAIPPAILEAAPESPFGFPAELFVRRGERSGTTGDATPTTARALEALGDGGTVLDVGVGGGATCLPLAPRCTGLTAVDAQADMLDAAARLAAAAGMPVTTLHGRWPDVANLTPTADVAVCGHVAFNVPDLMAFVTELTAHARRRVVMELTERHPLSWMNDLWLSFHGVTRPDQPHAGDAKALCTALGFDAHREDRVDAEDMAGSGFERREDAIALVRRRLCLPAERDDEIASALGDRLVRRDGLWRAGPREQRVVTLWWDPRVAGP
ncbi:MAG TPA: class I SAM-dependent methyltransferase [Actinomycetota bacterium]|nr:class I SAM-dependent methyltransferase [Actinomycetota bacterium]